MEDLSKIHKMQQETFAGFTEKYHSNIANLEKEDLAETIKRFHRALKIGLLVYIKLGYRQGDINIVIIADKTDIIVCIDILHRVYKAVL